MALCVNLGPKCQYKDKDKDKDFYFPLRTITTVAWANNHNKKNARTLYRFGLKIFNFRALERTY